MAQRPGAVFGDQRYGAELSPARYPAVVGDQRYGLEFGLPGDAYTVTASFFLINAAGDFFLINAAGDKLEI